MPMSPSLLNGLEMWPLIPEDMYDRISSGAELDVIEMIGAAKERGKQEARRSV